MVTFHYMEHHSGQIRWVMSNLLFYKIYPGLFSFFVVVFKMKSSEFWEGLQFDSQSENRTKLRLLLKVMVSVAKHMIITATNCSRCL